MLLQLKKWTIISNMNTKFSDFRKEFFKRLDEKTGWGKEQLKRLFDDTYFEMSNENIN